MNIGAKIKFLRKEKKVTQEELAEYLHISSQAVSKWETGASSPDIDLLPKLAIFFGTSLDMLLDFDQSQVDAAVEALVRESGRGGKDPAKSEAFLRKALEKYPNNDLLLTCILEDMQEQNADKSRSGEILEFGERILACTRDDELKIDVLRIMAETYHGLGEQAMAEYYLGKIPALHFQYYEIAAAIKKGKARLEEAGKVRAVITQNIDGLHQKAGSREVLELHGSVLRNYCTRCGAFYDAAYIKNADGIPKCEKCGGTIKPDVVLYEEGLDMGIMNSAVRYISEAEVLIIGGTSLVVYPAAGLIDYFNRGKGHKLILINKSATARDAGADLVITDPIGAVFDQIRV